MKKNKTYKRFDSDTYRRVMSILIYLESIEVKDIVRHVNHSRVYYRVRIDGYFLKLDDVSNVMKNLPKRYVVAFDTFMGKVFKRVMRRVHTFYRDEYYTINFLMDYLQAHSYIVPIGLDDIECVRMYAENLYDKVDVLKLVDSLRTMSVIVDSCDKNKVEKMKVVHTKETKLVRSKDAKNLMLAKDLALEFIDSGYDVIMRDGDDLVVYSNTDTSMQEYVPKSLHNVFYDVDKLDLLPLSYYVYMCK